MKKIIGIFIVTLLITTMIPVTGVIKEKNEYVTSNIIDQLDQYYDDCELLHPINNSPLAQTFKPTYPTITRVSIRFFKDLGGFTNYNNYVLKLMSGVPGGTVNQICSITVDQDQIWESWTWFEFDIIDQVVLPGATYHIEIHGINPTSETDPLFWCYGSENPYSNGAAYTYYNGEWRLLQFQGKTYDFSFKTHGTDFGGNHPPNRPSLPSGPSTVRNGTTSSYSTSSTDPDGDYIKYGWDWDADNTVDEWSGFEYSGDPSLIDYTWNNNGTYQVRVKAMDEHDRESDWSDPLSVTVPKSKSNIPFGFIFVFGFDVDVKIVQLDPGEDYVDLEVLDKPFYILENEIITRNPGEFIRLYYAKGLFSPSLSFCFGICDDWSIIG